MPFQKNQTPWNKNRIKLNCINCNNKFEVSPYRKNTALYCSTKCKGEQQSSIFSGNKNPFYGKTHSLESRKKMQISSFKGGYIDKKGYRRLTINGKHIFEHHKVWIEKNGKIPEEFCIHHKNGIKDDNRIENLELINHALHTSLHRRKKK